MPDEPSKLQQSPSGASGGGCPPAQYQRMLGALTDVTFHVQLDADGAVQAVRGLSDSDTIRAEALRDRLAHEHAEACRAVHREGEPVTVDVACAHEGTRRTWALTLVPAASADAAPADAAPADAAPADAAPADAAPADAAPADAASADEGAWLFGAARDVTASRQNRAALRERATIQQRLVELLPDAIFITGPDDRLLFVNSAAVEMIGADRDADLLDTSVWQYVHPACRARMKARTQPSRGGEPFHFSEQKLVRLDGEVVPIETASVPVVYQGQRAALIAARDLTGRKSMAEALSRTLDLFDRAFHLGPSALVIARLSDGVILEVSDQMVALTGYSADELLGRDLRTLDLWVDGRTRDRLAARLVRDGTVWEAEFRLRRKDGGQRTVLGSARRVEVRGNACVLASAIDITERRQAVSAAQESRTLLYKIFHASPTAIGLLGFDDTFFDANDALGDLVGYDRDALMEMPPDALWKDAQQYADVLAAVQDEEAVYDREVVLETASGAEVTTLSSFQRIQVEGRTCVLAVMTDITARKEAEETLVQAKERAEEIARFRSTLLSNMTHEIRTPLTVILGFTSMLHQGIEDDYRRFVHLIERSGRRLLLTLDSLLDLAQLEAGTLEVEETVHNVSDVVQGTAGSLSVLAEQKGLSFVLDLPEAPVFARFDHDLFNHALTHLIDNAVKFTDEGEVVIAAEATEDTVRVHVKDTGVGISEQFKDRLFDAFSQESEGISRTHQGSGLGLTVAQRLVERIGGAILHQSREDAGSIFTIELPKAAPDEVRALPT